MEESFKTDGFHSIKKQSTAKYLVGLLRGLFTNFIKNSMVKKMLTVVCFVLGFASCSNDDDSTDCIPQEGKMNAIINEVTIFDARVVTFVDLPDDNVISINGTVIDNFCLNTAILGMIIENRLGIQELTTQDPENRLLPATSTFAQIDDDATLGRWEIYAQEDSWVELDESSQNFVKGRFQATYLVRENPNNFQSLPDTLRFKNASFEAVINTNASN